MGVCNPQPGKHGNPPSLWVQGKGWEVSGGIEAEADLNKVILKVLSS